jgi:hypothetical protein
MRSLRIPFVVLLGAAAMWATARPANIEAHREDAKVAMIDDCDPNDPEWAPVGCFQKHGDVTADEFNLFLRSPLYANTAGQFLVGHPSWRNDPSHLVVRDGERIRVSNEGGRPHTFTKVAEFGGGRVPPLQVGTQMAPECALAPGATDPYQVAPGDKLRLKVEGEGIMKFQCCFHPWMRATVRAVADQNHGQN